MKKHLYLFMSLAVLFFVACSDDDDSGAAFTPDGKRLIAKITDVDEDGDSDVMTFQYGKNGRMEGFLEKGYYDGEEEYSTSFSFSYSDNKIVGKMTDKYRLSEKTYTDEGTMVFNLNDQGFIADYKWEWYRSEYEEDYQETGTFVYDDEGQLIRETWKALSEGKYSEGVETEYQWSGNELISSVDINEQQHTNTYSYTYTDHENKTNIDFGRWLWEGTDFMLDCCGYTGKATSKYLPKESKRGNSSYETFEYSYDEDGYPIKIKAFEYGRLSRTLTIEYK